MSGQCYNSYPRDIGPSGEWRDGAQTCKHMVLETETNGIAEMSLETDLITAGLHGKWRWGA